MSSLELGLRLGAGVLMVIVNAFFVATEFALTRLRQFDSEQVADDPAIQRAWKMTDRLEIYLTSCQLGITSSTVLLGVITEPAVSFAIRPMAEAAGVPPRALPGISVVVAVVLLQLIHKVWGEQAPTYLGVERPLQVLRWTARLHAWFTTATYPLTWLGDKLSKGTLALFGVEIRRSWLETEAPDNDGEQLGRGSLRRQMGELLTRGGVRRDRKVEVLRALEIDHRPIEEIMVPREEITALSDLDSFDDTLGRLRSAAHSRFPLVGESLEDYYGIIYAPALLIHLRELETGRRSLRDIAAEPLAMPARMPIAEAIDRFQEASQELALVEQDGCIVGLVTVTDAFEAIAGEVGDPFD